MTAPLGGASAIVGIGQTEFSKQSGRSELQLAAEASVAAITDAGLEPSDIDGAVTFVLDQNDELSLIRNLGIPELHWMSRTPGGGDAACAVVQHAAAAVATGEANAVLVYRAFNERSGRRFGQPNSAGATQRPPALNWYLPYGLFTPAQVFSLGWNRYMYKYGVTNEDFGRYSVVNRKHAANNPDAWFYERSITLEDHQRSRWIVEPILRLLDCCQESDGGVAFVVTSVERARDLAHPVAEIAGAKQAHVRNGSVMYSYWHPDLADLPETAALARELWRATGLGPSDIDVAQVYEAFTPNGFQMLEAFGFCGPGEAKDFVADGHLELAGSLPTNTAGGLMGEGYIHGYNLITEAVRQIRGMSVNQVPDATHSLVATARSAMLLRKG
jgi:acetyl-CoA acetyltransferase